MSDLDRLTKAQAVAEELPRTKLAALTKYCLLQLGMDFTSLGELDEITDEDSELD